MAKDENDIEKVEDESSEEIIIAEDAVIEEDVAGISEGVQPREFKPKQAGGHDRRGGGGRRQRRGGRGGAGLPSENVSDYTEKVVQVRRVTKVVKGGKKLSFRAVVIIGNEKGKVGVGVGKASEVLNAIKKAITDAKKHLVEVSFVGTTLSHLVVGKAGGAEILLKPAAEGTGIIAGGTARIVLELSGVGDVLAKSKGSKSPLNVARATVKGLLSLRTFQEVASTRGLSVKKMLHG